METLDRSASSPNESRAYLAGLLLKTGQGNHEGFTEFYRLTSPRVFGVVRRVVLDPEISEEVTQEIFILVWQDADKYNPDLGSPIGWLLTIAHRKAVDRVRSRQSSTNRDARWAAAAWKPLIDEVAESVTDSMETLHVFDSLTALSPLQRESILLAYFGCLTYSEVAERLSTPIPTIKSRIRDGLKRLRVQYEAV
ncbi:RNA polymerase sigma-70 factor (ECF subfamily) [Arthrobacter bambusae]|nr:RNA polymerase sigma-70 factor (ECF subfamily) [Arthrobacter bambusae]MDQ0237912.1 RNA polymerase sigma-70 factor (ECF subfamily) [Arthrobacter bambusae]